MPGRIDTHPEHMCPREENGHIHVDSFLIVKIFCSERLTTEQMLLSAGLIPSLILLVIQAGKKSKVSQHLMSQERRGNSQIPRSERQLSYLRLLHHSHPIPSWAQKPEVSFISSFKRIIHWWLCSLYRVSRTLFKQLPCWTLYSVQMLLTTG